MAEFAALEQSARLIYIICLVGLLGNFEWQSITIIHLLEIMYLKGNFEEEKCVHNT